MGGHLVQYIHLQTVHTHIYIYMYNPHNNIFPGKLYFPRYLQGQSLRKVFIIIISCFFRLRKYNLPKQAIIVVIYMFLHIEINTQSRSPQSPQSCLMD